MRSTFQQTIDPEPCSLVDPSCIQEITPATAVVNPTASSDTNVSGSSASREDPVRAPRATTAVVKDRDSKLSRLATLQKLN